MWSKKNFLGVNQNLSADCIDVLFTGFELHSLNMWTVETN
jgi:hypothetical protein